ncbi:MAG: hypothetical protein AAGF20_01150 [Pseudomonadota bacterium]
MLGLALKWLTIALVALVLFCVATVAYTYLLLRAEVCQASAAACMNEQATFYAASVGVFGFSISGLAAHLIGRSLRRQDREL